MCLSTYTYHPCTVTFRRFLYIQVSMYTSRIVCAHIPRSYYMYVYAYVSVNWRMPLHIVCIICVRACHAMLVECVCVFVFVDVRAWCSIWLPICICFRALGVCVCVYTALFNYLLWCIHQFSVMCLRICLCAYVVCTSVLCCICIRL